MAEQRKSDTGNTSNPSSPVTSPKVPRKSAVGVVTSPQAQRKNSGSGVASSSKPAPIANVQKQQLQVQQQQQQQQQQSALSGSPSTNKTLDKIYEISAARELRRAKQAEIKRIKDSMDEKEIHSYIYRGEIEKFRSDFQEEKKKLEDKGKLKVRTRDVRIRVCVRKRPINPKGAFLCVVQNPFSFNTW
jgi:hypothetical protein